VLGHRHKPDISKRKGQHQHLRREWWRRVATPGALSACGGRVSLRRPLRRRSRRAGGGRVILRRSLRRLLPPANGGRVSLRRPLRRRSRRAGGGRGILWRPLRRLLQPANGGRVILRRPLRRRSRLAAAESSCGARCGACCRPPTAAASSCAACCDAAPGMLAFVAAEVVRHLRRQPPWGESSGASGMTFQLE